MHDGVGVVNRDAEARKHFRCLAFAHADGAREHGGFVGEDVAEHVAGHKDVELPRVAHELHRRVVDVHVGEGEVGRVLRNVFRYSFPPKHRGLEDVGLVDRAQLAATLAGELEGHVADAVAERFPARVRRLLDNPNAWR